MLPENKYNQYGFPRTEADILGITIHETGNVFTAQELFDYLLESKQSNGCHYIVDRDEVIQAMPDDYGVYHTGKGLDWGNLYTIAIEITSNLNDDYFHSAVDRAVTLVKSLQERYGITNDNVFFHIDFNPRTYCPKTLLDEYGSSLNFVYHKL